MGPRPPEGGSRGGGAASPPGGGALPTSNGLRALQLCTNRGLVVATSATPRPDVERATWYSSNGRTWACSDHVLLSAASSAALLDCRARPGATQHPSDHV
eukprot:37744-Chlamydomonas_euryale.AAC.1